MRLINLSLERIPLMTQTNVSRTSANKTPSKMNGSTPEENPEQPGASVSHDAVSPIAQSAGKMVSISLPPNLHTKLRLLAGLTDRTISDIATEAVAKVIKAELASALAKVNLDD